MTPLVDVAFLLLTFFMFATTMERPQVMELQMPVIGVVPVVKENLLTLFVRGDNRIFYRAGSDPALHPVALRELRDLAVQRNAERGNQLITALKVEPKATYSSVVSVLDELNLAEGMLVEQYGRANMVRERRFTIAPMDVNEQQELETL
jgi:biopolymer transport protein ExbD